MTYRPTVRGRRLARELRRLRERQGLTLQDVADRLGWSRATVSRLETGQTRPRDVAELLDLYGVTSPERDALLTLSREARQMGWWTAYVDVFSGSYVGLEDESSEIRTWDAQLVHGLLQTEEYARAVITSGRFLPSQADVDRRIHARRQRQALLERSDAPHLHVVLDEAAVRRPIGGESVMRDQLVSLVNAADLENITIQVMPLARGAHAGLDGRFTILSFPDPADPDIAYVEGTMGDVYIESAEAITQHRNRFERITDEALSPEESVRLIAEAAKE